MKPVFFPLGPCLLALGALAACGNLADSGSALRFPMAQGAPERGRAAFVRLGCLQCHTVAGADLPDYPVQRLITMPLGGESAVAKSYDELASSIIAPAHVVSEVYLAQLPRAERQRTTATPMYANSAMTVAELVDIVAFLDSHYSQLPGYAEYYYPGRGQVEGVVLP